MVRAACNHGAGARCNPAQGLWYASARRMASDPSRPRMPIGISDFHELRGAGGFYVDKTDFVIQMLTARSEVVLVPRPRRFGKTVNLSTMRYFVETSAEDRSALFEGLA